VPPAAIHDREAVEVVIGGRADRQRLARRKTGLRDRSARPRELSLGQATQPGREQAHDEGTDRKKSEERTHWGRGRDPR